jgi:hypothetical protein
LTCQGCWACEQDEVNGYEERWNYEYKLWLPDLNKDNDNFVAEAETVELTF